MAKKRQLTYREAISEIEGIVAAIENESIDIDILAQKVNRASELLRFCKEKLTRTKKDVEKVLESFEEEVKEIRKSDEELF